MSISVTFSLNAELVLEQQKLLCQMDQKQEYRAQAVAGYTDVEHFTVRNSHFDEPAELTVRARYRKETGKTYETVSRKGPSFLQNHVLDRILLEEASLSRGAEQQEAMLTTKNYRMQLLGMESLKGKKCYVIALDPKRHSTHLIKGKVWVSVGDLATVRVQGKPAANPSFWTGHPMIEREYTTIHGFSFPQHSHATSRGFFSGKSELDIEYGQYSVSLSDMPADTLPQQ